MKSGGERGGFDLQVRLWLENSEPRWPCNLSDGTGEQPVWAHRWQQCYLNVELEGLAGEEAHGDIATG